MADQCIVCLDELDSVISDPDQLAATSLTQSNGHLDFAPLISDNPSNVPNGQHIAKIKVCGHILHDECLQTWTLKANSCPICRTAFNLVQVYDKVGGELLSERTVEDKKQVAEFDPTAWIDDQAEELEAVPCPVCGSSDDEHVLLLCDGCDAAYHTHCIGLDSVPDGHWFCMECEDQRAGLQRLNPSYRDEWLEELAEERLAESQRLQRLARRAQPRTHAQRTLAQVRRARRRHQPDAWSGAWNLISARVWDHLNIDLEYGDEDGNLAEFRRQERRTDRERRDFRAWQQRLAIASRQGARHAFEDAARTHLSTQQRAPTPKETREEAKAWDTFNTLLQVDTSTNTTPPNKKRKRSKSKTASPVEPEVEPERKRKRPKTRRIVERPESSSSAAGPSRRKSTARSSISPRRPSPTRLEAASAPSFLSSLLKEVEMSAPSEDEAPSIPVSTNAGSPYAEMSSPAASPIASSYSTPRAMSATPPPALHEKRPGSPTSLSSRVEPMYPHPPSEYSNRASPEPKSGIEGAQNIVPEIRQPRPRKHHSFPQTSPDVSPSRTKIPISAKEGISKIVRTALEPHYKKRAGITKEQYATINRLVSHMLYDRISDAQALEDENRAIWERLASAEVAKAVEGLTA